MNILVSAEDSEEALGDLFSFIRFSRIELNQWSLSHFLSRLIRLACTRVSCMSLQTIGGRSLDHLSFRGDIVSWTSPTDRVELITYIGHVSILFDSSRIHKAAFRFRISLVKGTSHQYLGNQLTFSSFNSQTLKFS